MLPLSPAYAGQSRFLSAARPAIVVDRDGEGDGRGESDLSVHLELLSGTDVAGAEAPALQTVRLKADTTDVAPRRRYVIVRSVRLQPDRDYRDLRD